MIISHSHKSIFIKSIKTAGTSIEAALSNYCGGDDVVTPLGDYWFNRDEVGRWIHRSMNAAGFQQHDLAITIKNKVSPGIWDNYFKFSVARNPWDRVVSLFAWEARNKESFRPRKCFYHHLGVPFDELREIKKLFSKFVKQGKWETNDPFYIIDGRLCVDFIIRYENLIGDVNEVCKKTGLPEIDLPRLKTGLRKGYHYSEYYDEDTKAIVAERHKNDIRLFGYKFERENSNVRDRRI